MVIKVSTSGFSLTNNGLRDWLLQRISAVILGFYYLFMVFYFMFHPEWDSASLRLFFKNDWMRIFTLLAILSLFVHAWVGMWTVMTDYVKPLVLRVFVEMIILLLLLIYFLWAIQILWR